jgi:Tol biopolymer transport system component
MRILRLAALFAFLTILAVSCGTDPLIPSTGTLTISTTTAGEEPDPDGYTVQLDSEQPQAIGQAASLQPVELISGDHVVMLTGLAANCGVAGENPRTVTVTAGGTAAVAFQVTCTTTAGGLRVTTVTTGVDLDPDGYVVTGDGIQSQSIGVNAARTVSVASGLRDVSLSGIASNCHVQGENPRRTTITATRTIDLTFSLSCDLLRGSRILFLSYRDGVAGIYTIHTDGTQTTNLVLGGYEYKASWSPDGSRIAFESDPDADGYAYVSVMNADGTGQTILSRCSWFTPPAWSPDGRTIAFLDQGSAEPVGAQIFVIGVDAGARRQLTHGSHINSPFPPSWSPDGSRILFARSYDSPRIFTVAVDGGREDTLSTPGSEEYDRDPQWSRDGSRIGFIRQTVDPIAEVGVSNLWVMNGDGSRPVALTHYTVDAGGTVVRFAWAPDGNGLIFSNVGQVNRIHADGSGQTRLFGNLWPIWSPDRTRILFEQSVGGQPDLFVMNADGSNVRNLTNDPGQDGEAAWQP